MKVFPVSLGCDKNSVDTEVMMGYLKEKGYEFTLDENEADIALVNTCSFINDAKEESINTIIELGQLKEDGNLKAIVIAGCLGQRYTEDVRNELPEVDAIVGINSLDSVVEAVDKAVKGIKGEYIDPLDRKPVKNPERVITTGGYYDYLKIAEGCDKHCTYCAIPLFKGNYRSIPMEDLLEEAANLAARGVKELILVAQETTVYGTDIYHKKSLPELLHNLCKIDGLEIIRVLYLYPEEISDEIIETIKSEPKIAHYIDMPIQSGSNKILKLMGRRTSREQIYELVAKLRKEIPDICLRTTLISGFPGEDEDAQLETLGMVKDLRFDRLGVFAYSEEEGTPAALLGDKVPEEVKEARRDEIMSLQQQISFEKTAELVGNRMWAIIEGSIPEENIYVGRTYRDIPDVDGYVFIDADRELLSGDIVEVEIKATDEYDLIGGLL